MSIETIVGRAAEQRQLAEALTSKSAELVAVYGRRRVGKTHLVREFMNQHCDVRFFVLGEKDAPMGVQLDRFHKELQRTFGRTSPQPTSWREAFKQLSTEVKRVPKSKSVGVFLDELPWLATHRSGLVQALDYEWNSSLSRVPNLCFVVCGSAASWMLNKLVHAKGGLYNRVTRRIQLLPFNLRESRDFLATRHIKLNTRQVVELYLAIGGIPHYLKLVTRGRSAAQAIADVCFSTSGILHDEYEHLFASLFNDSESHRAIVEALAKKRSGMTRSGILHATGQSSGGRLATRLDELEAAGFIARVHYLNHVLRDPTYRLLDEYVLFYLHWIRRSAKTGPRGSDASYWLSRRHSPAYYSWAGLAFEALCLKHAGQIKRALGIETIPSVVSSWWYAPEKGSHDRGAQVDLLFDREDNVIQLCEIKYTDEPFTLNKAYAQELARKLQVFETATKTRKQIRLALLATHGLKRNVWSEDLIDAVVTADDLFTEVAD